MARNNKNLTVALIVIGCIAVVLGVKAMKGNGVGSFKSADNPRAKGDERAPLKITEYIDFQCPACAAGSKYLSETFEEHPDLIRLQMKYFPLQMHKHGYTSAFYAECAAQQGKFWPYHDLLLNRQPNWKRLDDAGPAFEKMADDVQMDREKLNTCLQSDQVKRAIEKNILEGQGLGIRSTPTYYVNGKMVVGMQSLQMEINKHLNENSD